MDIASYQGRSGGYTLASRQFELAEIKTGSGCGAVLELSQRKESRELIGKLETLQ